MCRHCDKLVLTGLNVTLNEAVFNGRMSHFSGETEKIPFVSVRKYKLSKAETTVSYYKPEEKIRYRLGL